MKAKNLCVAVTEAGERVVSLKFPSVTIGWVETLMPDKVREKIEAKGIDLTAIKQKAEANGMQAQELFALESGNREYRVWLE